MSHFIIYAVHLAIHLLEIVLVHNGLSVVYTLTNAMLLILFILFSVYLCRERALSLKKCVFMWLLDNSNVAFFNIQLCFLNP